MNKLGIPDDVEVIFVDDGSWPPIKLTVEPQFKHTLIRRDDPRIYTVANALNAGLKVATGHNVWVFPVDAVFTAEAIKFARRYKSDKLFIFERVPGEISKKYRLETQKGK